MKRVIAVLLLFGILFGACRAEEEDSPAASQAESEPNESDQPPLPPLLEPDTFGIPCFPIVSCFPEAPCIGVDEDGNCQTLKGESL